MFLSGVSTLGSTGPIIFMERLKGDQEGEKRVTINFLDTVADVTQRFHRSELK